PVAPGCQEPAEAHRDRARCDLSEPRGDEDPGGVHGAGEPGCQREGDRQAVRHPDHDVANRIAGGEVTLDVMGGAHGGSALLPGNEWKAAGRTRPTSTAEQAVRLPGGARAPAGRPERTGSAGSADVGRDEADHTGHEGEQAEDY